MKWRWTFADVCRYETGAVYTHEHQKRGGRELRLCDEEGGPLGGAWLGPRRNGNRFNHKQTVVYLGHWAALGESPIGCRAYGSVQHADPSSVQTVRGMIMWERAANFAYRLWSCTIYLTHRSRPRITHTAAISR